MIAQPSQKQKTAMKPPKGFMNKLVRPFITGILTLFPLVFTIGIVVWLGSFFHRFMGPDSNVGRFLSWLVRFIPGEVISSELVAYLIGVCASLVLIYFLGILVEAGMKNRFQALIDRLLKHVPIVNTIYDAAKKIVGLMAPKDNRDIQSMTPVLCQFGEKSTVIPAFMPTDQTIHIKGEAHQMVMIPTAPIPFGGALICVPTKWITPMDCGIDGLLNLYMTMGFTAPDYISKPPQPHSKQDSEEKKNEE